MPACCARPTGRRSRVCGEGGGLLRRGRAARRGAPGALAWAGRGAGGDARVRDLRQRPDGVVPGPARAGGARARAGGCDRARGGGPARAGDARVRPPPRAVRALRVLRARPRDVVRPVQGDADRARRAVGADPRAGRERRARHARGAGRGLRRGRDSRRAARLLRARAQARAGGPGLAAARGRRRPDGAADRAGGDGRGSGGDGGRAALGASRDRRGARRPRRRTAAGGRRHADRDPARHVRACRLGARARVRRPRRGDPALRARRAGRVAGVQRQPPVLQRARDPGDLLRRPARHPRRARAARLGRGARRAHHHPPLPAGGGGRGPCHGPQPRRHQGHRHRRMKAALVHGPGDLRIEDVADPVAGHGEAVLRIGAAMTCGTDVKSVARGHPTITSYPAPLGHEFAGTVESVGPEVTTVAPGDVVFCADSAPCGECRQCERGRESLCEDLLYVFGGFAEKLLVPARVVAKNLHPLPPQVPLALAPLAEPLACAVHAIDVVDVPERVTILGAGSLGLMLTALVDAAGGAPTVLDPHPERLELARDFGAARTVVAVRGPEDVARAGGADLVIEAVGRPEAWELAVAMAAPGGVVNLFGGCARGSTFIVPTARVHYEEVTVLGTYHHAPRYISQALQLLAAGEYPWASLVGPRIALSQLPEALAGRLHSPVPPKYSVRL